MPHYEYKAKNLAGNEINRTIEANDNLEALKLIREEGYYVLKIKEKKNFFKLYEFNKVNKKQLAVFCNQLQVLIHAGISIYDALYLITAQTKNKSFKKVLVNACEEIQRGETLYEALSSFQRKFPKLLLDLICIGEHSGALEIVLKDLSRHYEEEDKLQKKVLNSLYYPCFVLVSAVIVALFLMLKIVPIFASTLSEFNSKLPKLTLIILTISEFTNRYYPQVLLGTVLAAFGTTVYLKSNQGKKVMSFLTLKLPYVKRIYCKIALTRFCRYTALLLKSGVSIIKTLEISNNLISNHILQEEMQNSINNIKRGRSLTSSLRSIELFDDLSISMISIGEHSGNLDYMLNNCAEIYDNEIDNSIKRLTSLIEPIIIVFLALMVGTIVLSVILPVFDTMNAIN